MKKHFNFKSVYRTALVALCLMTVGVGEMWATQNLYQAYLKCDFNGAAKDFSGDGGYEYTYNQTMTGDADGILYDLGTLDAGDFVITYLSWYISTPDWTALGR